MVAGRESGRLLEQLAAVPMTAFVSLSLEEDRGYDCATLRAILQVWNGDGVYRRHRGLQELLDLARALWDWECRILDIFKAFAWDVRQTKYAGDFKAGRNSHAWAFIAVVFGWEDIFGEAVMDVPGLQNRQMPTLNYGPGPRWPAPIHYNVLRYIISMSSIEFRDSGVLTARQPTSFTVSFAIRCVVASTIFMPDWFGIRSKRTSAT